MMDEAPIDLERLARHDWRFLMSVIRCTDPDFRVCRISFDTLLEIQAEAEERRWATRWSSVNALRSQVTDRPTLLQSFMREEREMRCGPIVASCCSRVQMVKWPALFPLSTLFRRGSCRWSVLIETRMFAGRLFRCSPWR